MTHFEARKLLITLINYSLPLNLNRKYFDKYLLKQLNINNTRAHKNQYKRENQINLNIYICLSEILYNTNRI